MENKEISIEEYLKKIGFDEEESLNILEYASNEIDRKVLHEKIKYLISLGLDARQIRIVIEEDITFVTEDLNVISSNGNILKQYLNEEELKNAIEVTPELLSMKEGELEQNIRLLNLVITNKESQKIIMQDRGEILTYKPDYLSDKFSFFIKNGLKDQILKIIIESVEIFDLENDEINIEELK